LSRLEYIDGPLSVHIVSTTGESEKAAKADDAGTMNLR